MEHLGVTDVRRLLDLADELSAVEGPDPFPQSLLEHLAELVRCGNVAYFEWGAGSGLLVTYQQSGFDVPRAVGEAALALGMQRPTSVRRLSAADGAVKLSDLIRQSELVRSDFYREVMRPLGVDDELKLILPTTRVAGFSFLGKRRFTERDRLVLELLAPHLARSRERTAANGSLARADVELTEREWDVLTWVARGKTNKEIAALLLITPNTVRKHLENVFDKLGVHTRTAAVARVFSHNRKPPQSGGFR